KISDDNFADPLRALGHARGEFRLPLDCRDGNPVTQEKAIADGARDRIGGRARRGSRNADRPRKDGPPAIWRLNNNGARVRCGLGRNDLEADLIRNGRPSACQLCDGFRVDPVALRQRPQARLTMLYRSTDCLCRRSAPMKNLAHSASFESFDKDAPSKPGIKHLAGIGGCEPMGLALLSRDSLAI